MVKTAKKKKQKRGGKPKSKTGTRKARHQRPGQPPEAIDPKVAVIAKDPRRAEIVAVAIQRPYSPSEYARDSGTKLNVAAYAFKVLREHHVLELVETPKVRGATKHMYRANEAAFFGDRDWGALAPVLRPGIIGATFGNFNGRVAEAEKTGKLYEREDVRVYWAPREFDEKAWEEHAEILAWAIEESDRLVADTVNRRANGESKGSFRATVGLFLFPSPTHSEVKKAEREERRRKREAERGKGQTNGTGGSRNKTKAAMKKRSKAGPKGGKASGRGRAKGGRVKTT